MQVEKIKKGDEVNFIRPMTNIKTYGTVIDITKDGKYLNIRNSIGDLDFVETSKVKLGGKPYKGFALGGRIANKKFKWIGETFTVKKVDKGKVYTTSGRIFNLDALEKAGIKFEKDPNYKPIIRPLYGEAKELAKDRYYDMLQELKDLKAERKQLFMDMEYEAGLYDREWTDDDANRYGGEFNRLDDAINSLENKTKQLHDRIYNYKDGGELIDDNEKKPTNWAATNSKLLINNDKLTPVVYRKLMSNARNGILKQMAEPDDKVHFWNSSTKEYVAKITTYKGEEKYYYSDSMDENGNLTMANGGDLESFSDNQRMVMNQNVEIEHHHEELEDILEEVTPIPAWVVAKMETATQNLSDITHYLDGQKELMEDEYEKENEDEYEKENEDGDEEEIEVVEPIIVNGGSKTEISKNFTEDALDNFRGFLKGMEGVDLRDDYTFDYKGEQFEIEPIINSNEKGVSNAIFSIFDGDGEEVGEVAYSREGGKQKFTANSDYFQWNNAKFEDGGFMNNVYADGGRVWSGKVDYKKASELLMEHKPKLMYVHGNFVMSEDGRGLGGGDLREKYKGYGDSTDIKNLIWTVTHAPFDEAKGNIEKFTKGKYTLIKGGYGNESHFLTPTKKMAEGGYFDGTIPKVSSYMSTYAKGGMVVTSVEDIPNFTERLKQGRITYRGLGMGKVADDFYKLAGTSGTRIKVDGKEYFITDEEFDTFSRGADGKMQIRFDAPSRRHEDGGFMNNVYAKGGGVENYLEQLLKDEIQEGKEAKIYKANFDGRSFQAQTTQKSFLDGVPIMKTFSNYKTVTIKGKHNIVESENWWYFKIKNTWYAVNRKKYGTPPFDYENGGSLPFMTDPNFGNFQNTSMFNDGGKLPKVGDEVSGRWNDSMKWTLGTFKGETKNGFEVYNFTIEEPDHIEYYAQITQNPHQDNTKIFYSNNFKDRNYKNYNFKREKGGFTNDVYAYGGHLEAHGLKLGDKIIKTIGNYQKVQNKEGNIVYVDLETGYRNTKEPTPFNNGGKVEKASSEPRIMIMNKYIDKFGTHYGVNLYLLNVKINESNEKQVQKYIDEGLSPFDIYEKLKK